jgi:hypothetical protein
MGGPDILADTSVVALSSITSETEANKHFEREQQLNGDLDDNFGPKIG